MVYDTTPSGLLLALIALVVSPVAIGTVWMSRYLTRGQRSLREMFLIVTYWGILFAVYVPLLR